MKLEPKDAPLTPALSPWQGGGGIVGGRFAREGFWEVWTCFLTPIRTMNHWRARELERKRQRRNRGVVSGRDLGNAEPLGSHFLGKREQILKISRLNTVIVRPKF